MRRQRCSDSRALPWPKLYEDKHGFYLRAKFLTPLRFSMAQYWVYEPLSLVWRLVGFFLTMEGLWSLAENRPLVSFPFDRLEIYGVFIALGLLWWLEMAALYPLVRFVFGKYLTIHMRRGKLLIGGRFRKVDRTFALPMNFELKAFEKAREEAWQHSQKFSLLIDQTRRIGIAEIFNPETASHIVTNANLLLYLGGEFAAQDQDIDPTRLDEAGH